MTSDNPSTRPDVLLLLGSGDRNYRRYALEAAAGRHPLFLLDTAPATWQLPHVVDHAVTEITDLAAVHAAVRSIAQRYTIRGVLTWNEYAAAVAAEIADELDLPGPSPAAVTTCRDKAATRAALDAAGVPSARWQHLESPGQARAAADTLGYPVIVKPASAAGSAGVSRVDHPDQLPAALAFTTAAVEGQGREGRGYLVEEYLAGPEVSVEIACDHGRRHVVAITRKSLGPEPYCEETGHLVAAADTLNEDSPTARVALAALDAVGYQHGIAHVELRLTPTGPRVIEVNARLGGDLIPHLVSLATGVDLARAATDLALGEPPRLHPTRRAAAAITFFYPVTAGTVTHLALDADTLRHDWVERAVLEQRPGAHVAPPPSSGLESRLGHVIVTGRTATQVRDRLERALPAVHAHITHGAPIR